MSLLDPPVAAANAALLQKVNRLKRAPFELFTMLYGGWAQNMRDIWENSDPQAVLDGIGTNAGEMFLLSQKTVAFLEQLKPGCTTALIAKMKPFTVNPDGTITITPE